MNAKPDFYRLLHVQPDAPIAVIRSSYRALMQKLKAHPDLGGGTERAALLNEAYAVLSDAGKRAAYDRERGMGGPRIDPRPAWTEPGEPCPFCRAPLAARLRIAPDDRCGRCACPLFPAERHRLDFSGQRVSARFARRCPVVLYTEWPQSPGHAAEALDLSLNGMRLMVARRIEPGTLLRIECELFAALARVAYARADEQAGGWALGAEFLTLRLARSAGRFVSTRV